ncbi:MAG: hypothetical protein EOP49_21590 [Sphingobacteriales bacterium]|nr:MAG: hypothetical protein EOP49_21590 [Sphingobacteriales bacterium]
MTVITIILVLVVASAILFHRLRKQSAVDLAGKLKELADRHQVNPGTIFTTGNRAMSINKAAGFLFYVEQQEDRLISHAVDITRLKGVELIKRHGFSGSASGADVKQHLAAIDLHLNTGLQGSDGYVLSFYSEKQDQVSDMKMLFQKAWHWKRLMLR